MLFRSAVVTIGVRQPELLQPLVTYTSGGNQLVITAPATLGIFTLNADLNQSLFPPGDYEVGVIIRFPNGTKRQMIVATLPVVDGVVNPS